MTTQETPDAPLTTALPDRMFGLTIDNVSDPDTIVEVLGKVKGETGRTPVVRIVFDVDGGKTNRVPDRYKDAIKRIKEGGLGYVVGEILDSFHVRYCAKDRRMREKCYVERTQKYLDAVGEWVDLWEVGNEMNGEWVGWRGSEWAKNDDITAEDMQRMRDSYASAVGKAHELLTRAGKKTALTFYFNDDGERHAWFDGTKRKRKGSNERVRVGEHYSMIKWAETYRDHFADAKYVFVSYYEDDQFADDAAVGRRTRIIPGPDKWAKIFAKLRGIYGQASFGFGEMGAQCHYLRADEGCTPQEETEEFDDLPAEQKCDDRRCGCCLKAQREYVNRYYVEWDGAIRRELGRLSPAGLDQLYVGGYFYWHFNDDVLNKITASKDGDTPPEEKVRLEREAADTLNALIAAGRRW